MYSRERMDSSSDLTALYLTTIFENICTLKRGTHILSRSNYHYFYLIMQLWYNGIVTAMSRHPFSAFAYSFLFSLFVEKNA
jgi:hypothetical protein